MPPTEHKLRAMKEQDDSIIPATKPEDDVMDVLSEFETGLESLKALYVQRQKLQTRIRDQEEQCKQRETAVAQRAAEIELAAQEQAKRMAELDAAKAALEQREKELAAAREALQKQEAARSAKSSSEDAAAAKAKVLEEQARKLAKEAEAIAKLTGSMNAHAQELEEARAAIRQEQDARQTERSQIELLRKQAEEQRAALESQEGHNRELAARVEAMGKQLDQAKQEALKYAQHAAKLESASSASLASHDKGLAKANDALAKAHGDLTKANARAESLQGELAALRAEFAAFKEQAEQQAASAKPLMPASTASTLRRRQRLKIYRDLVRQQSLKVRKASDAIKKKVEACEQLLAQRSELAAIRDRVLEGERRLQRRRAGSRSVVTLLCALASFAVVAALSWTLAREVAPATYMANSTIKAEGRGRELNKAELQEWTNFHTSLLSDPMFHESAADRFKRAGYPTLGSPEAVAQMIRNDFSSESSKPGEMQLHLKGQGAEKAQHTLETFTAALASHANAQLQKRVDGGVTAVSNPASSDDEPLDNTRMLYFVGILMAGVALCVAFVVVLWKRLARAKTDFEQDTVVSDALDNTKWAAFAAAAAAQQGSMAAKIKPARE